MLSDHDHDVVMMSFQLCCILTDQLDDQTTAFSLRASSVLAALRHAQHDLDDVGIVKARSLFDQLDDQDQVTTTRSIR